MVSNPLVRPTPVLLALALAACSQAAAPEPNANQQNFPATEQAVALGDTVWFGNSGISVVFREVRQDSRCPSDVMCVWSGNAVVALDLAAQSTGTRSVVLNTTVGDNYAVFQGYRIMLKALDPTPVSTDSSAQRPYVAHLTWQFLPD
jgi:hypothetical protein